MTADHEVDISSMEGIAPFEVMVDGQWETLSTWYRIVGGPVDASAPGSLPLIVAHGGPGATHDYLRSIGDLAVGGRTVVFYDQLGNGRSTHLPRQGADFWTVDLFVKELQNLVTTLVLADGYHLLGQSWGGFLAQEYALTFPVGLVSLVLADTAASFPEFLAECNRLRELLPPEVQQCLLSHEKAGTTDDPDYLAACDVFYRRHVCRLQEWPAEVTESFAWIDRDPTVYHTMNGPSEFHVIGSIKDWSVRARLPEIAVPTLLLSGAHDEAGPAVQRTLLDGIPGSTWTLFQNSAHMPHVEERDRYMDVLSGWLADNETPEH
jgi:L-proline amide hydrolase